MEKSSGKIYKSRTKLLIGMHREYLKPQLLYYEYSKMRRLIMRRRPFRFRDLAAMYF
jgi:hypothetical protein